MHLWRSGQQVLTVEARLPLDLALVPAERRQLSDSLSVRATADGVDLSVLEALTPLFQEVGGVFTADVGIAGTWEAPRLRGGLVIRDAAATMPALNVRYEGITGRLTLSGDTIRVDTMAVRSDRGRADVSGFVRLERLTRPVLALDIAAHEFKALDLKQNVSVTASGRLALRGPVIGATLTGRATVTSGVLYFADLVKKRIVNLDELVDTALISLVQEQRLGPEFESVFFDSLGIRDLELDMGSDVWLRSTEANIQLTGTVLVKKERDQYLVSGTLQAPRGTYLLKVGPMTREFVVTEGTVKYFGTPDQDAELNIEARHTVHPVPTHAQQNPEDVTVVAHITGTLLVPRVTLEVEKQDLSQTEVISYLLFGKPSFDTPGADQGGIASQQAWVRTFASVLSGELERTIVSDLGVPVDYVEIRPGGQADRLSGVQLAVGRQLGPKTFLVVDAGFCEGRAVALRSTLGLSLQFRISPEFRTEASFEPIRTCPDRVESQTGNVVRQVGFDFFWEKRY
jgi:translocation and assembly module TamB